MVETNGSYNEPISPKEAELLARLEAEAGPEVAARLRAEGEALVHEAREAAAQRAAETGGRLLGAGEQPPATESRDG